MRTNGQGKHPASSRGQARYIRREISRDLPRELARDEKPRKVGEAAQPLPPVAPAPRKNLRKPGAAPAAPPAGPSGVVARVRPAPLSPSSPFSVRPPPEPEPPPKPPHARRGLAAAWLPWRRSNRRITVESWSPALWIAEQIGKLARRLLLLGKILAALLALAGVVALGRVAVKHVVESPRFALREVRVSPTAHVTRDEIVERSTVVLGDRLLALDTDVIAARLARHPWIAAARVRRELPGTLVIDITERKAAAVAVIGGLYLIDPQGHPFKHAALDEADGHVVLTGISRSEYAGLPQVSEAAFREALAVLDEYQHPDSLSAARYHARGNARPALSEINIDPRAGFTLFLYDGGAEIRLGRGAVTDKLARLDEILGELGPRGLSSVRVVHLDGPASDRVPLRLAPPPSLAGEPDKAEAEPAVSSGRTKSKVRSTLDPKSKPSTLRTRSLTE